jgi:UDP-glucose 4-epimerase
MSGENILITGASGYMGKVLLRRLVDNPSPKVEKIICTDIKQEAPTGLEQDFLYRKLDVRDKEVVDLLQEFDIKTVIHLASIVTPGKNSNRDFEYSVDVLGTKNMLEACVAAGVQRFIVTSSGAAYGYHPDNPHELKETDELRGNYEFAYSHHKKLIEKLLMQYREDYPQLKQFVFRPGTILGNETQNQITNLFEKAFVLGIKKSDSRFNFIWDRDCADIMIQAISSERPGVYNVAGDGNLDMSQISTILERPYIEFSDTTLAKTLEWAKKFNLTQYGPEQVSFLKYRPVLNNEKLKTVFQYKLQKTSKEAFLYFLRKQKTVFITGGVSGLGLEMVKRFHADGHIVAVASVEAQQVAQEILPNGVSYYQLNVKDDDKVKQAIVEFYLQQGRLDLVIANAGISMTKARIPDFKYGTKVIETNVIGVLNTFGPAIEIMKQQKEGQLVAMSSLAGVFGGIPGMAIYGASKSAVFTLCESLEIDLKKLGIDVTTIAPGFIKTPLTENNGHSKPMELEQDQAGQMIYDAIIAKKSLYMFPFPMKLVSVILRRLPRSLYKKIMRADLLGTAKE